MAKIGLPYVLHGEVTTPRSTIFDARAVVFEGLFSIPIPPQDARAWKVTMGSTVTTSDAVSTMLTGADGSDRGPLINHAITDDQPATICCVGAFRPHYLLPAVANAKGHRQALVKAAHIPGIPRFFLGPPDSAAGIL